MKEVMMLTLVALAAASATSHLLDLDAPLESDEIIQAVNNAETTWKAGRNFDKSFSKRHIKNLLGLKRRPDGSKLPPLVDDGEDENLELPENFDARQKWKKCISLQTIRDQGACGSCWAVAAASAFSDRLCIATKGRFNGYLSAEDLLSCCKTCAIKSGRGCEGGYDLNAWNYILQTGICTGGEYNSKEGCLPYTFPPCQHARSGPRKRCNAYGKVHTPKCQESCSNKKYWYFTKDQDLHLAKTVFSISNDTARIQKEIFKYGPLEARLDAYEDFFSYKSGIYQHKTGRNLGGHAVKVIGWGIEKGTPFWLVANSWNTDWGDDGLFKIKRGNNECNFESELNGGYADV